MRRPRPSNGIGNLGNLAVKLYYGTDEAKAAASASAASTCARTDRYVSSVKYGGAPVRRDTASSTSIWALRADDPAPHRGIPGGSRDNYAVYAPPGAAPGDVAGGSPRLRDDRYRCHALPGGVRHDLAWCALRDGWSTSCGYLGPAPNGRLGPDRAMPGQRPAAGLGRRTPSRGA